MHNKLDLLDKHGFVVLRDYSGPRVPESEWLSPEYLGSKTSGKESFAPIASAIGGMEVDSFWNHGKPDKDANWTKNAECCPTLVKWVENVGANFGRVRVIKLNHNTEAEAIDGLHLDDNNRLNPENEGWVVRLWLQLTDDPNSYMILREDRDDSSTEIRIPLGRNSQLVVDSERLWHTVWHAGPEPRYALITSFESGEALQRWIESQRPTL